MRVRALFACSLCVAGLAVVHPAAGHLAASQTANTLLSRARMALGGEAALAKVQGLTFELTSVMGSRPAHVSNHSLLLPDRYEQVTPAFTFTLAGTEYWSSQGSAASASTVAALAMRRQFARWAIIFLASDPQVLGMTLNGRSAVPMPDGSGVADVLTYAGRDQFALDLFLDRESGRPVAYSWPFWSDRPGPGFLATFAEFRDVGGISFPSVINARSGFGDAKKSETHSTVSKIVVNPTGLATRFVRR